jgi:hypothetical protein
VNDLCHDCVGSWLYGDSSCREPGCNGGWERNTRAWLENSQRNDIFGDQVAQIDYTFVGSKRGYSINKRLPLILNYNGTMENRAVSQYNGP